LRHETYNLDAEAEIGQWLSDGRVDLLAFNDHMDATIGDLARPNKRRRMVERTGLASDAFDALVERVSSRADAVPASIARLAKAANAAGIRMLSHDDGTPAMRQTFRAQGISIAEFPVNEETAREAADGGDDIVFGAPNVVRGGSHTGWTRTSDMIAKGLCSVLASDYYYPAQLLAAFRLVHDGVLALPKAWDLISAAPSRAAGLDDRGTLAAGQRADIILVDDSKPLRPRLAAVISAGRLVHIADSRVLARHATTPHKAVAMA
jgi:alpha-D-ribose 1-methylphosphonate 5-triphosphate diphosphatase